MERVAEHRSDRLKVLQRPWYKKSPNHDLPINHTYQGCKLCRINIRKNPLQINYKKPWKGAEKRSNAPAPCSKEMKGISHDKIAINKLREGATTRSQILGFFDNLSQVDSVLDMYGWRSGMKSKRSVFWNPYTNDSNLEDPVRHESLPSLW